MLTGDEQGILFLAKTIASEGTSSTSAAFPTEYIFEGVIDPNVGRGSMTLLLETTTQSEMIVLPWITGDVAEIIQQSYINPIDSVPIETDPLTPSDVESDSSFDPPDGFTTYNGRSEVSIAHPVEWFVTEFPDGTLQVSAAPIVGNGATPLDISYLSLIAGESNVVGLPPNVQLTPDSITQWILGDFTIVGGEDGGTFISSQLEVANQYMLEFTHGGEAQVTEMIPTANINSQDFTAYILTGIKDDRIIIVSGFVPAEQSFDMEIVDLIFQSLNW